MTCRFLRWVGGIAAWSVLIACSSDEFASTDGGGDAAVDAALDGPISDAIVDAAPEAGRGCDTYAGPGFCDDFDTVRDGSAGLDPRWLFQTVNGAVSRDTQIARSAPGALLSTITKENADSRAVVAYSPNVATVKNINVQLAFRLDASCAGDPGFAIAASYGVNGGANQRTSFAITNVGAGAGGPKLSVLAAQSDLDGGNVPFPFVFVASVAIPLATWVDVRMELRQLSTGVRVRLVQQGALVLDQTTTTPFTLDNAAFTVGVDTKARVTTCAVRFDDVVLEATQ